MIKLLDNGNNLTLKGVQESLMYRQINHQEVLILSAFTLFFLASIFVLMILVHDNKYFKIAWGLLGIYMLVTLAIGFNAINTLNLYHKSHSLNFLRLFYMCDTIIIAFGYAFKVSYEWINLLVFAIIEPVFALYLLGLLCYRKFNKNRIKA